MKGFPYKTSTRSQLISILQSFIFCLCVWLCTRDLLNSGRIIYSCCAMTVTSCLCLYDFLTCTPQDIKDLPPSDVWGSLCIRVSSSLWVQFPFGILQLRQLLWVGQVVQNTQGHFTSLPCPVSQTQLPQVVSGLKSQRRTTKHAAKFL